MNEGADIARQERIEAYVAGRLTEADTRAFEAKLAQNDVLRADVEIERVLQETQRRGSELRFRDLVRQVSNEQEQGAAKGGGAETPVIPIGRKPNWTFIAAAASIALVVTVGITQWMRGPDDRALAMAYAELSIPSTRGDEGNQPYSGVAELDSALTHLLAQQPEKAIALLAAYSPTDPALACKRDWLNALALLQQGDDEHAEPLLERVIRAQCYPEKRYATELKEKL